MLKMTKPATVEVDGKPMKLHTPNFSYTPDPVQQKYEARVMTGAIVVMFAISGLAWWLSTAHLGYWWTVLLSVLLGR